MSDACAASDGSVSERGPSIARMILERAETTPDDDLVVFDGGGQWSCQEALNLSWSIAAGLRALGVAPGEPVLSWLPNGREAMAMLFGANAAGAVYAPLNIAYRGNLLEHAINLVGARVLVVHADLLDRLPSLTLPHLQTIVVVGAADPVPLAAPVTTLEWAEFCAHPPVAPRRECDRAPEDDLAYIYTSGTTGPSKAVRCSHLLHDAYADWFRAGDLGAGDRALVALPMYHIVGTGWTYSMLRWKGSIAVAPRFSTDAFWSTVRSLGVTTTTVMAAMGTFLMNQPESPDDATTSLRIALAVPEFPGVYEFGRRFGVELWTGYAMSEVPGPLRTGLNPPSFRTAGALIDPAWSIKLVDDQDEPVADGSVGELTVRHISPGVITSGYVNMPEATEKAWRGGWFHTGDLFRRDSDGNYYFVDRNSDALRRRGENISSLELEQEITSHPGILECAVIGMPAAEGDDEVMAFVVAGSEGAPTEREIFDYLTPRVPHYMVPRYIEFIDALPRTPTEKVRKMVLRDRGLAGSTWDSQAEGLTVKSTRVGENAPTSRKP